MFARFKNFLEPIERPYCYLLPLGVVVLGDRSCGTTLLLLVTCYLLILGVANLGGRTCVPTLLLVVSC